MVSPAQQIHKAFTINVLCNLLRTADSKLHSHRKRNYYVIQYCKAEVDSGGVRSSHRCVCHWTFRARNGHETATSQPVTGQPAPSQPTRWNHTSCSHGAKTACWSPTTHGDPALYVGHTSCSPHTYGAKTACWSPTTYGDPALYVGHTTCSTHTYGAKAAGWSHASDWHDPARCNRPIKRAERRRIRANWIAPTEQAAAFSGVFMQTIGDRPLASRIGK